MEKKAIKILSVMLIVTITLTSAHLSGILGFQIPNLFDFSIGAKAFSQDEVVNATTIIPETTYTAIIQDSQGIYVKFVPTQSGDYVITSNNTSEDGFGDPLVRLYDVDGNQISYDDDGGGNYNFKLTFTAEAGTTYYIYLTCYGISANYSYVINSLIGVSVKGSCGENLTWEFNSSTQFLIISGTGAMYDYYSNNPWEAYKESIKTIVIGEDVTSIGKCAFDYCTSLTLVKIGDSVTSIGDSAFAYCVNLTSITIPDSVILIGTSVFKRCDSLTKITVDNNNQYYSSDDYGVLFNKDKTTLIQYPMGNTETSYVIPDSVITVGEYAFRYCTNLETITIPCNVEIISNAAFCYCSTLSKIFIGGSLTSIGKMAFYYCDNIIEVYYTGTADQWSAISIDSDNTELTNASFIYEYADIHSYEETFVVAATCETPGLYNYECVCGNNYSEEIPAIGHDLQIEQISPTCMENGYTIYECTNGCGLYYIDDIIYAPGHYIEETVVTLPNCVEPGYKEYICNYCMEFIGSEEIEPTGHSYEPVVTPSTCTTQGYTTYTCSVCNDTYISDYTVESPHEFYQYSVTLPTCTEYGYTTYACTICGATQMTYDVEPTGHYYEGVVTSPTCTEQGYTTYTCSVCSDSYIADYVSESGHSYVQIITEKTESAVGYSTEKCSVCGDEYTDINVYSDDITVSPGDTISVPVYIDNNRGIIGFKFTFDYDYEVLTPVSVRTGDIITKNLQDNITGDSVPGKMNVYWHATDNLYDNGIAFYINFTVNEFVKVDETQIDVSFSQDDTFDENFNDVYIYCNDIDIIIEKNNQELWYESGLQITDIDTKVTSQEGSVEAGNNFLISVDKFDGNTNFTDGTQTITYDESNLIFIGYMTADFKPVTPSTPVNNSGNIVLTTKNGKTYNADHPSIIFEDKNIKYLVFKADEFAKSGEYSFNYEVNQDCGITNLITSGCVVTVTPSAVSELARINMPNNIVANQGDTIQIPIYITNNKGMIGYRLDFTYNSDDIEIIDVSSGELFGGSLDDTIGQIDGEFYVVWYTNDDNIDEDGVLLYITAKVLTSETVLSDFGISYSQEDTFNDCFEDVVLNCIDGSISLNAKNVTYIVSVKDVNGNTVKEISVDSTSNTTIGDLKTQLSSYAVNMDDKAFISWYDSNSTLYNDEFIITEDIVLYPLYEYNKLIGNVVEIERTADEVFVTGLISSGTTVGQLKSMFSNSEQIIIINNGIILNDDDLVGTGFIIKCVSNYKDNVIYEEAITILYGDINGDGLINKADYDKIVAVAQCLDIIENKYYAIAADVNKDGAVDSYDAIAVDLQMNDIEDINQFKDEKLNSVQQYMYKQDSFEQQELIEEVTSTALLLTMLPVHGLYKKKKRYIE